MRPIALLLPFLLAVPAAAQQQECVPVSLKGQSPVNIRGATATPLSRLVTHYPVGPGRLFNDGHRVQVNVAPGSAIIVNNVNFALQEFHFHWPAEHRLMGNRPAAEIHMVHKTPAGRIAVVGTWIHSGAYNPAWAEIWRHLPHGPGDTTTVAVNIAQLFGFTDLNAERVYRYCGSLTTPDFAEGVTWLMRQRAITMSATQLRDLRNAMPEYSRDTMPLGGRVIRYRHP